MHMSQSPRPSRYIHGYSKEEQIRLSLLNNLLNLSSLRELNLQGGERIIDLGCGLGQFTRAMARAAGPECTVLGIERDPRQLAEAVRLASEDKEEHLVEFRQGDALDLHLNDEEWGSFDIAHTRLLLEQVHDPLTVVSSMVRTVRPGGRIILEDDDHENFHPFPEPAGFRALWQSYIASYERLGNDPNIGRRLISLLHTAGADPVRNSCIFFGGCAGNQTFGAVADNLIATLEGARQTIVSIGLLDKDSFGKAMAALEEWKKNPYAAIWYVLCWAEGVARLKDVSVQE